MILLQKASWPTDTVLYLHFMYKLTSEGAQKLVMNASENVTVWGLYHETQSVVLQIKKKFTQPKSFHLISSSRLQKL